MKGFDLDQVEDVAAREDGGTDVAVTDENEEPVYYTDSAGQQQPCTIRVAGSLSAIARRFDDQARRRPFKPKKLTTGMIFSEALEKAVACTLGWTGIRAGEQELAFNPVNVRRLYTKCPWILDAVTEAMNEHSRFTKSS